MDQGPQDAGLTVVAGWEPRAGARGEMTAGLMRPGAADGRREDRFELLAVAARGFRPPRFLTFAPAGGTDEASPPSTGGGEGLRQAWSLLYRRIAETRPEGSAPYAIYLLGVDPPPGATDAELAELDRFYTDVHLVEVAERRRASRAVRYELVRPLRAARVTPRYLAVYELDEQAASVRRHVGPPYSPGPAVWQAHTTPWRLWYRHLDPD